MTTEFPGFSFELAVRRSDDDMAGFWTPGMCGRSSPAPVNVATPALHRSGSPQLSDGNPAVGRGCGTWRTAGPDAPKSAFGFLTTSSCRSVRAKRAENGKAREP